MTVDTSENNYSKLKEIATREGISLFGVANLEGLESEFRISPEEVSSYLLLS